MMQSSRLWAMALLLLLGLAGASRPSAQEPPEAPEPPPVVWEPWSDEAFQRAREEQKGVLLTVVHPYCRPCSTADREVYADPVIRLLIDRLWIPVRVDAYERPDLDSRYRLAQSILTRGESGYPVTAFLFPTGEAIWADTFIPAEDREARPGMRALLERMDHFWKERFSEARRNAMAVQASFDAEDASRRESGADRLMFSSVVDHLITRADTENGGYGPPPRRQNPMAAELILLASVRRADEGLERQALDALRGPVRGALFDRLEGGFHRATRARDWSVPWFGKDLIVNATYLHSLVEAVRISGDEEIAAAADKTVDYLLGTLKADAGGFYSAQAPSPEEADEAAYYAWDAEKLAGALDEGAILWARVLFGFREKGEPLLGLPPRFTLKSLPRVKEALREAGLPADGIEENRARLISLLRRAREAKEPPPVMGARYLDSTAMACSSLLAAGVVLNRHDAVEAALQTLQHVLASGDPADGLPHSLHDGEGSPVLMVDQAWLGNALLDAHEATGERRYLKAAEKVAGAMLDLFDSPDGAFYDVIEQKKAAGYVRLRRKVFHDSVSPSPLVAAARLLFRLGHLQGEEALVARATKAFDWGASRVSQLDMRATTLAIAADSVLNGPVMIHVDPAADSASSLRRAAAALYEPAKILRTGKAPGGAAAKGAPGLTMCLGEKCTEELTSPEMLAGALSRLRGGTGPRSAAGQAR